MRIAIPVWNGRVSPVFDVAHEVAVFDVDRSLGTTTSNTVHQLRTGRPSATLDALGVDLLICSAVSPALEAVLWVTGIEVLTDVCGSPPAIAAAVASGDSRLDDFRSPGIAGQGRSRSERPPSRGQGHRPTAAASTGEEGS